MLALKPIRKVFESHFESRIESNQEEIRESNRISKLRTCLTMHSSPFKLHLGAFIFLTKTFVRALSLSPSLPISVSAVHRLFYAFFNILRVNLFDSISKGH